MLCASIAGDLLRRDAFSSSAMLVLMHATPMQIARVVQPDHLKSGSYGPELQWELQIVLVSCTWLRFPYPSLEKLGGIMCMRTSLVIS